MKKNNNMLKYFHFATLFLVNMFMLSCEKEFLLDQSVVDNRVVVNSIFNDEDVLSLTVTKNMKPQQNQKIIEFKNAKVSLYKNGTFVEDMVYSKDSDDELGRFYSGITPIIGSTYKVEVETILTGKAISQSVLPPKVDIVSDSAIWVKWTTSEDSMFSIRYYFEITINDPPENNYYFITASVPVYQVDTINNTRQFQALQYAEILSGDLPKHEIYLNNALLFKDVTFNATSKKITGTATFNSHPDPDFYDGDNSFILDKSKLHIELHSLSADAYNFCSSYAKKIASQDDIYSEPTVIYSNIENGLGVFAGENITKRDVLIRY